MTAEELWKVFCEKNQIAEATPYEAWAFGGAPDYLAGLVMQGIKTATASGYELYFIEGEEALPKPGDYSVVLNSKEEALCVIQTIRTEVIPFDEVGEEQAYKEGEGDRSLAYWRRVHEEFFKEDFASCGATFTIKSKILCEEFKVLYSLYEVTSFDEEDAKDVCDWRYDNEYAVYNYPCWDECVKQAVSLTDEALRNKEYFKVLKNGQFLGYFRIRNEEDTLKLGVGIRPELCGNHNGNTLIHLALAKVSELYPGKKITLTVRQFNKRAIACYENAGFKIIKKYYEDRCLIPGDMYVMEAVSR